MKIHGHGEALSTIPRPLPPTLLITGPAGIGKHTIATKIAEAVTGFDPDLQILESPTIAEARQVSVHHRTAPIGSLRVSLIDLTSTSAASQQALLKVLEDSGPQSRFILHSNSRVLPTVTSRCFQVRLGPLSHADLSAVLRDHGLSPDPSVLAQAGGSAAKAIELAALGASPAKQQTIRLLSAISEDSPGVDRVITDITSGTTTPIVISMMVTAIQASFTEATHAFGSLPFAARMQAIDVLGSKAHPSLRLISATQALLGAVRQAHSHYAVA
jgi:hypothetical protein